MLNEKLKQKKLILASKSPRRQQFLKDLNVNFTIQLKEVEEIYPSNLKGKEIVEYLAKLKAAQFTELKENNILITSDTIVWHKENMLGKPKSAQDAIEMIKSLSNNSHKVHTAICLTSPIKQVVFTSTTKVVFKKLTTEEIEFYVQKYAPFDKAGGYGIQEWIGLIGVKKIKGSYFNVMGFPVHKFYKEILKF